MVKKSTITRARVDLEFNRMEYSTNDSSLSQPCEAHSYTSTGCKLHIPFGIGSVNALLQVTYDGKEEVTDYNYLEYLTVDTNCNFRADSWTVIWLPVMIINIAAITILTSTAGHRTGEENCC